MTIQSFITKAIEGGYDTILADWRIEGDEYEVNPVQVILLDPEAWQAVGKTEGWEPDQQRDVTAGECEALGEWFEKMHRMIDALADGKTITEFLETL